MLPKLLSLYRYLRLISGFCIFAMCWADICNDQWYPNCTIVLVYITLEKRAWIWRAQDMEILSWNCDFWASTPCLAPVLNFSRWVAFTTSWGQIWLDTLGEFLYSPPHKKQHIIIRSGATGKIVSTAHWGFWYGGDVDADAMKTILSCVNWHCANLFICRYSV